MATTTATTRILCRTASATTGAPAPITVIATGAPTATTAILATVILSARATRPAPPTSVHQAHDPNRRAACADCYVGGIDYVGEHIEGSTTSLAITMPDSSFGMPGRWTPEVGP